jgi:hypothetical protein
VISCSNRNARPKLRTRKNNEITLKKLKKEAGGGDFRAQRVRKCDEGRRRWLRDAVRKKSVIKVPSLAFGITDRDVPIGIFQAREKMSHFAATAFFPLNGPPRLWYGYS